MSQCFLKSPSTPAAERESALQNPERERLRILVIGSRDGVIETIHDLYRRGFAEVSAWSPLLPAPSSGEVMSILTRDRGREG
jgi:alkanesulfonate monooxygenase SsuD/methylene tetrahydromethanopterin reductase-like flavin-dependent oxidoreductase (luciferase family)